MTYPSAPPAPPCCYRHPDRVTYVSCTRCQRYVCPDCMRSAAVGHQCVDCVAQGAASIRPARTLFGGDPHAYPYVTYTLIAVNVVAFVLQKAVPWVYENLVMWPAGVAYQDEWYRLITANFLHSGIIHIALNMWALYVTGPALERWLGRGRFIALYALGGLGSSVLVYLITPVNQATLGASGAIFALFGATLVLSRRQNVQVGWIVGLIAVNLVVTFSVPSISWQGHVGGLLTGLAVGALFGYTPQRNRAVIQTLAALALFAVFVALIMWRTASLLALYA